MLSLMFLKVIAKKEERRTNMTTVFHRAVRRGIPALCLLLLWALPLLLPSPARATVEESEESFKSYDAERAMDPEDKGKWLTASHRRHEALQQEFTSGPEVTAACLSCHIAESVQMMQTIHWTWVCPADPTKKMGKAGLTLNNF
mgnify:CR=1 FL=1